MGENSLPKYKSKPFYRLTTDSFTAIKNLEKKCCGKLCARAKKRTYKNDCKFLIFCGWAQQGMILRPPDYER